MSQISEYADGFLAILVVIFFWFILKYGIPWANSLLAVSRAPLVDDKFFNQYGYNWDFVLVFKVWEEHKKTLSNLNEYQEKFSMANIVARLNNGGLETRCFFSAKKDLVYVKIRGAPKRLMAEAARIKYSLQLNPERVRSKAQYGRKVDGKEIWKPIVITDDFRLSKYMWYDFIYGKFDLNPELQSMWNTTSNGNIFRGVDRIKLLISCMQGKTSDNPKGCGLDLDQLKKYQCIEAAFSLHDYKELSRLQSSLLDSFYWPWNTPINDIKNYFGEKIGLYFAFLSHYTSLLILPAIFGGIIYIIQHFKIPGIEYIDIVYSFAMIMWNSLFQELWRQKQARLSMEWGVKGYLSSEQDRPQFDGVQGKSPIDGSDIIYFPHAEKSRRMYISTCITLTLILLVVCYVGGVFVLSWLFEDNKTYQVDGFAYGSAVLSTVNAIVIQVLNIVYTRVAIYLNDYENHRTDTEYEDNLIAKIFGFQVINSYSQIIYVAFIKVFIFPCTEDMQCLTNVQLTLSSIFAARLLVANTTIFVVPLIHRFIRNKSSDKKTLSSISPIEQEFLKLEFNVLTDTLQAYAEIIIQFGFTTMFVAALSAAPFLAFLSGYVMISANGWKLCQAYRRPAPKTAESIGTWEAMLDIISALTVISNFALIFFTASYFAELSYVTRVIMFLIIEHFVFLVKFIMNLNISDVPEEVQMQLDRQEFLVGKILLNKADEFDDKYVANESNLNLIVHETDPDWNHQSSSFNQFDNLHIEMQ